MRRWEAVQGDEKVEPETLFEIGLGSVQVARFNYC